MPTPSTENTTAPAGNGTLEQPGTLEQLQATEASHFLPVFKRPPLALVRGSGSYVWDDKGRRYTDLTSGWGVNAVGHCHPRVVQRVIEQTQTLIHSSNAFYTAPQLELARRLVDRTPDALTRAFFVSSGTEATDGALKLAHRATNRHRFISTLRSFHGRTLGALGVLGQDKHRARYRQLLPEHVFVEYDNLAAAEAAIDETTAAVIIEPIQGEGGVHEASGEYLKALRRITHERGALLILDEIQTGIGRTGTFLASDAYDVVPDVVTLGKGLGGGFPIAGWLTTEAVANTVLPGDHGGTYAGNPVACAGANATLEVIESERLVDRARSIGQELTTKLRAFAEAHPDLVQEVRGRGLLQALELKDEALAAAIPERARAQGVLVNMTAERVIRLFPALNIEKTVLWPALDRVLSTIASERTASPSVGTR